MEDKWLIVAIHVYICKQLLEIGWFYRHPSRQLGVAYHDVWSQTKVTLFENDIILSKMGLSLAEFEFIFYYSSESSGHSSCLPAKSIICPHEELLMLWIQNLIFNLLELFVSRVIRCISKNIGEFMALFCDICVWELSSIYCRSSILHFLLPKINVRLYFDYGSDLLVHQGIGELKTDFFLWN